MKFNDALSDLKKGRSVWCCSNMVSKANPWWMVNNLSHDHMRRLYQIPPDIANGMIRDGYLEYVDAVPPVKSWRRSLKIKSWGGYRYTGKDQFKTSPIDTGEKL